MTTTLRFALTSAVLAAAIATTVAGAPQTPAARTIDLAALLTSRGLRAVNRTVAALGDTTRGVHVSEGAGPGVVWIEGSDFAEGTIELDVRGRDVLQQSFVGVAFHRKDDAHYEGVYLRPFNFRAQDPERHRHAVQYIAVPDYDWPRLREQFPDRFESAVDSAIVPTEWVPLRVVVTSASIQVFVGHGATAALQVRPLGSHPSGAIGLWTGNNSDGAFANLRVTPAK